MKFLLFVAIGATLLSLGLGIGGMFGRNKFYKTYSNQLMQLRVLFQGIALILFAFLLFFNKS